MLAKEWKTLKQVRHFSALLLTIKDITPDSAYGLWHITESNEDLEKLVSKEDALHTADFHPKRKAEYFATRLILKELVRHFGASFQGIVKDQHGKPFLKGSDFHISISHSYPYVACILHRLAPCGIDLETPRMQLQRIQQKFLSTRELALIQDDLDELCQYWCAKETLYKIYGRKQLIFAENIRVDRRADGSLVGQVILDNDQQSYELHCEQIDGHYLVCNI